MGSHARRVRADRAVPVAALCGHRAGADLRRAQGLRLFPVPTGAEQGRALRYGAERGRYDQDADQGADSDQSHRPLLVQSGAFRRHHLLGARFRLPAVRQGARGARLQCRHLLPDGGFVDRHRRNPAGRLVEQQQVLADRRDAKRRADDQLRAFDRAGYHDDGRFRRHDADFRDRRASGRRLVPLYGTRSRDHRFRDLSGSRYGRDDRGLSTCPRPTRS